MLIQKVSEKIGTEDSFVCVTRPRRFGKSVNAHMLGAYFTKGMDSRALFDDLAIGKTEDYLRHMFAEYSANDSMGSRYQL